MMGNLIKTLKGIYLTRNALVLSALLFTIWLAAGLITGKL